MVNDYKIKNNLLPVNDLKNETLELEIKSLKNELVYKTYFYTKKQAKLEIFKYFELFYNRVRSHSYLNGLFPVVFEEKIKMLHSVTAA
ncbi:IS3 family transposase [Aliarcobacter skirrowii]|uniref:IS3 family transposase n=1 Tax=Aliarcobacter skirrowii TaxID=28200 RepID=UPI0021B3C4AE|nr:IS3 family transposase [Aliarcobacter skirrowii]MCT7447423.1 IS3 family transposase [Aliarcobacter skirrowii]